MKPIHNSSADFMVGNGDARPDIGGTWADRGIHFMTLQDTVTVQPIEVPAPPEQA